MAAIEPSRARGLCGSAGNLRIAYVDVSNVARVWPQAGPLLAMAAEVSLGRYLPEDVRKDIESGEGALWAVYDGDEIIAATSVSLKDYPRLRALVVHWIGGDRLAEWQGAMDDLFVRIARQCGAAKIEFIGRKGWDRIVRPYGYVPVFVCFEKAVLPCAKECGTTETVSSAN